MVSSTNTQSTDESRMGISDSGANTIFPPYVNLRGISMDDEESQFSQSPRKNVGMSSVQDEYDFLDDSLPCLPSTSSGLDGRIGPNYGRYTSDSEDGGLDSESTVSEIRFRHPKRQVGTAYFDYVAKEQDELSLKRGSVVEIIQKDCDEDGWMLAKVDNKKGMVPKNYIGLVGCQPKVIEGTEIQRSTESIGRGGFANVFQGTIKGKAVALKIPRPQPTSLKADAIRVQAKVREALEREALIFCRLDHTNIVDFYGICLDPLLLVLELCEGGTLFSLCRKMVCSDALTTIYWAKQVASAMDHLHSREDPLVHADLKADNVLIKERPCECGLCDESWKDDSRYTAGGTCKTCAGVRLNLLTLKITDFGLSRNLSTKRDSFGGSVSWMSPEVIEKNDYSKQSDVWSFAVFLWEVLSCQAPFSNYDFHVVMYAVVRKEKTLHVPENCPIELRDVFSQCWKRDTKKRPSFAQILQLLEVAEKKIDNSYKWNIKEENQKRSAKSSQITLDEIKSQIENGIIKVSAEEIVQRFSRPPVPDVKSRKNRGKKGKVNKESIGAPSDFRHNVSVRPSSESPPPAGRSGSQGKLFKVKYAKPPTSSLLQSAIPPLHSSHSAIEKLSNSREQPNLYADQPTTAPPNYSPGFTTLPRNYKHLTIKSANPVESSSAGVSIDKYSSRNKVFSKHINCTQKCCSPTTKLSHLAPFQFDGPPKPSKSNPELVNCGLNSIQTNRPNNKTSPNCPRITRTHDYVALDGRGSDEESFHRHYRQKQRSSIDTALSTEEYKLAQKTGVAHTLGRTNAFRRKLMNISPRGSVHLMEGESSKNSVNSSKSSNLGEGENLGNTRGKSEDNNKDHVVTLPSTILNIPKTPNRTPAHSFTATGRPSIDGGCSRSRKSSNSTVQSTFYVDYDRQDSCASEHSQESESVGLTTSRRRSSSKKLTHILTKPFSKMFNAGYSHTARNFPSPAHHCRNCSCGSTDGVCVCTDTLVVECAICYHPHHSHGENTQMYDCLHDYVEHLLQLDLEMPYTEFVQSEPWCYPSSSSTDKIFYTVAQSYHGSQTTPNSKTFVKRVDYADHQRQRHRTESAAAASMLSNSSGLTPTSSCSTNRSAHSGVAFRVSPNTTPRHTANSPSSSSNTNAIGTSGFVLKNSSPSGLYPHLSMNTVIPSQPQAVCNASGSSIQSQSLTLSRTIGITQSYTDLHRNDVSSADAFYSTLSPPTDILHSRSRSSDNPVESVTGCKPYPSALPITKTAGPKIPAQVLAERINNKPVPSGPVVNRSYVHMPSSLYQKHQQRHQQPLNYSLPPAQVPPLPLRKSTASTPTSVTTPIGLVDPVPLRPTALPRSILPSPPKEQPQQQHPWPTSNAPVLHREELQDTEPTKRPNTLNLATNSQIGRSQSFYSTKSGRDGDSGLCTAESNIQLNTQQNYCQLSASEVSSPESRTSSVSSHSGITKLTNITSDRTTTANSSATNSSPSPTSSPYIMLSDSSSLPVLYRLKPQHKDTEDELYSQVLPRSQAPKLSDTIENSAYTPTRRVTNTLISNGRVAKKVATTPNAIIIGSVGDKKPNIVGRNLVIQPTKVPRIPMHIKYYSNARPAPPKLPPPLPSTQK